MKKYICLNHGECNWADEKPPREFTLPQVDENVCPNCGSNNIKEKPAPPGPLWGKIARVVVPLLLVLSIVWFLWPSPPPPLVLKANLNCQTGLMTLTATGGNGDPIIYDAEGLDSHLKSNVFTIPIEQRSGKTFTFYAVQSGDTVSITYTSACAKPAPKLTLSVREFNCLTGVLSLSTTGGDGTPITFMADGLSSKGSNNVFIIPKNKQAGSTLSFFAIQNGDTLRVNYTTNCQKDQGGNQPPASSKWTRVTGSEFCVGDCIVAYSEIDNLGHTRERRVENYAKCCPANK